MAPPEWEARTWWTCHPCHKRAYLTRTDARRVRRRHPNQHELQAYRCPTSNAWHLGHKPQITEGAK